MAFINARNNVVHELGHAFAQLFYGSDRKYDEKGPYLNIPDEFLNNEGFYKSPPSASRTWQQHPCTKNDCPPQEIFADMFLGGTFDTWASGEIGPMRDVFMTTNMTIWIADLLNR
ncbi:MAG: hypothetical protein PHI06_13455 [Desulfobulbaceae bacterium]|nr:hypothetical protein [Desulfobulbaceae bacterium]